MSFNFNFGGMPNFDLGIGQFGQEAMDKRQQANEARNNASNQYEADVADFRDREATEAEDTLSNMINQGGIGGLQDWNWGGEPGFTASDLQYQNRGITNNVSQGRSSYDPIDNWGEPGYEIYDPADEIIDPIQDFVEPEVSPFVDTNPYNDIWVAPTVELTPNVGAGAGTSARERYAPINNPFEPVETGYDPTRDQIIDPGAPDPGMGGWNDPDAPGPIQDYWDDDKGVYEPPINITPPAPPAPPAAPPPIYTPPPPPPMATGPTATPMNRLIAMQTGMFGGQPQGQYRPYEEPSEYTTQSPLNQPAPFPIMHGGDTKGIAGAVPANQGKYLTQQPTRDLKKLFNNPLDKGLGELPVMGQNDTLTQTVQAGFRPRR